METETKSIICQRGVALQEKKKVQRQWERWSVDVNRGNTQLPCVWAAAPPTQTEPTFLVAPMGDSTHEPG